MLGPIAGVTITAPAVAHSVAVYQEYLGYELRHEGRVSRELANFWSRPALAGRRVAILTPASGAETCIRFVEGALDPAYRYFGTLGWNAAELIVKDVDALAYRLRSSPFRVIGPPADLSFSDQIRAMQVVGPSEEVLYLTMVKSKIEAFDLPIAGSFVDRVFIMILGGASLEDLQAWYAAQFALPATPVIPAVITALSQQYGLPPDHLHRITALPLAGQCYVELDEMPPAAACREQSPDELPPGIAIVTFEVARLPALPAQNGTAFDVPPYHGRRAALVRGVAGELIELVASAAA